MVNKSVLKREAIILLVVAVIAALSCLLAWIYHVQPLDYGTKRVFSRVAALGFSCVVFVYPGYLLLNAIIWLVEWVRKR